MSGRAETMTTLLPVIGLPGRVFEVIHVSALVVLSGSVLISAGVLIYLLRPIRGFFARSPGDRLVVYLSVCDLLYSISHMMDHSYMLAVRGHPPDLPCAAFAFFLNEFILAQSLIVIYAALNAFALVVLGRKLNTGKYDWRLLVYGFGTPTVLGLVGATTGHFGPSGAWCYIDLRKPAGPILNNVIGGVMIITFLFIVACYAGIWIKIRQAALKMAGENKYQKTARVMTLFVAAYIAQYWAFVVYTCWNFAGNPHPALIWMVVVFANFGGLFNFLAYTFIRKRYQKIQNDSEASGSAATATQHQ